MEVLKEEDNTIDDDITTSLVDENDSMTNRLIFERKNARNLRMNSDVATILSRQKMRNMPGEDELDDDVDKVNLVRLARANYLQYLNQYNVSY